MSRRVVFPQTEVRLSEMARGCARLSYYRATGEQPAEHDSEQLEWFQRGHLFEHYVVSQLIAKHGADNVERNYPIQHPLGVGHADALIGPERLLVEIKSSTTGTLSTPVFDNGVRQLKRYLHYADDVADRGALYMINPTTLKPADVFEVRLTDDDREEIATEMVELARAIESREAPARVCSKPSQARGYFCPFAATCFGGWEPDPLAEITSPDALAAASELAAIKQNEAQAKATLKALEEGRKDAEARLAELVPVGKSVVGPFELTRTHVKRQPSFSVKAYQAAGHSLEPLAEFFRDGAEYDTWKVTQAESAGAVDFGEEAPF